MDSLRQAKRLDEIENQIKSLQTEKWRIERGSIVEPPWRTDLNNVLYGAIGRYREEVEIEIAQQKEANVEERIKVFMSNQ